MINLSFKEQNVFFELADFFSANIYILGLVPMPFF